MAATNPPTDAVDLTAATLAEKILAGTGKLFAYYHASSVAAPVITMAAARAALLDKLFTEDETIALVEVRDGCPYAALVNDKVWAGTVSSSDAGVVVVKTVLQGPRNDPRYEVVSSGNLFGKFLARDYCIPLRWHGGRR